MDYSDAMFPKKRKLPGKKAKKKGTNHTKRLDALVRKIIRARDQGCVTPNEHCSGPMEVSHFIGRGNFALRWDLRNCNAQCVWHNRYHDKDREPYRRFLAEKYGEEVFEEFSRVTSEWYASGGASAKRKEAIYDELMKVWEELRTSAE